MPRCEPYERAAATLLRESGCTIRRTRATRSGVADLDSGEWAIEVPAPRGPISFGVFAHEVGHQVLHRSSSRMRWRQEVEAEEYALAAFDRFGLAGRARYEAHAARHLAYSFAKAIRRSRRLVVVIPQACPAWWERAVEADGLRLADAMLAVLP